MAIDFTLTSEQKMLQTEVRDFAEHVLAPIVREADAERDPLRSFALTKPEKEWSEFAKKVKGVLQSEPGKDISVLVEIMRND